MKQAEADIRELMNIPGQLQSPVFTGGGISAVRHDSYESDEEPKVADYIVTGQWAKKAAKEAEIYGEVHVIASSEDKTFSYIPDCSDLDIL